MVALTLLVSSPPPPTPACPRLRSLPCCHALPLLLHAACCCSQAALPYVPPLPRTPSPPGPFPYLPLCLCRSPSSRRTSEPLDGGASTAGVAGVVFAPPSPCAQRPRQNLESLSPQRPRLELDQARCTVQACAR